MALRTKTSLTLALVLLVTACRNVEQDPPNQVVIATFSSPDIPTPNDLALQAVPTLLDGTQKELLRSFVERGGFPNDQEVAITVPIKALAFDAATNTYRDVAPAPTVNVATLTPQTAAVLKVDGGAAVVVDTEAGPAAPGTIVIRKKADASGSRRWAPGRYVFALRGGAQGVKTTDGIAVAPDTALALTIPNKDLSKVENQPTGGLAAAQVQQLEALRAALWSPLDWGTTTDATGAKVWAPCDAGTAGCLTGRIPAAFAAVDAAFPHAETASIGTFEIAPAPAVTPLTDAGSGQIPLPSNLLLDGTRPVPGTNGSRFYVRNVSAFGAAAAGIATLDGFSTTGLMLMPLTGGSVPTAPGAVRADSITPSTVFLFELPPGQNPRLMKPARIPADNTGAEYLLQPPDLNVTQGGISVTTAIGLQPAVAVPSTGSTPLVFLPPLKEKARYLVVVTDGVQDVAGQPIQRSTLANILFGFTNPPVDQSGKSQLPGVSDTDAQALAAMRTGLSPILDNIGALTGDPSLTRANVVMAYTVQTQTVTDVSVQLSALPYADPASSVAFTAGAATPFDPASVGLDAAQSSLLSHVNSFVVAPIPTVDAIDPATGAFRPDPATWVPTGVKGGALIAIPNVATSCTPSSPCKLPLVVWHHGLPGGKYQMLTAADALAARGFVVAAIDSPYNGDRAFCATNHDCTTDGSADGVCTPDQAMAGQGDLVPPGTCTVGHLRGNDLASDLTTVASGNYVISPNFFRIRDGYRQDLLDQSALVLALARPPSLPATVNGVADALLAKGIQVDPDKVYLEGVSIGGLLGTEILATNPRFARGVIVSAGGTIVDIFTNAPAYQPEVAPLFAALIPGFTFDKVNPASPSYDPVTASRYAQILILAKWILDPAEPLNFAQHVTTKLPSPLTALGSVSHGTTDLWGALGTCDPKVPNATTAPNGVPLPYGDLLYGLAGIPSTRYQSATGDGCLPHAFFADTFATPSIADTARQQAAEYLLTLAVPSTPIVPLP